MIGCVYVIAGVSTFLAGLQTFFDKTTDSDLYIDPYTPVLPIAVFVFDCDFRRVFRRSELKILIVVKVLFWLLFSGLYVSCALLTITGLFTITNYMMLIAPFLALGYSFILIKYKQLSTPLSASNEEQYQRFE